MNTPIEQFVTKVKQLLPEGINNRELEKNIRALAGSSFSKLNLVSRDEFDAQTAVLARTREKLEKLEAQVEALIQAV
jgi:BMFP domain-containing protein YqiC